MRPWRLSRFARRPSLVLVVDRIDDSPEARLARRLADWAVETRSARITVVAWEWGSEQFWMEHTVWADDLPAHIITVRWVETINAWRLPIWLARRSMTRPVARKLRQARVRWWFARMGRRPAVVFVGDTRPELDAYAPPAATSAVCVRMDDPRMAALAAEPGLAPTPDEVELTTDDVTAVHQPLSSVIDRARLEAEQEAERTAAIIESEKKRAAALNRYLRGLGRRDLRPWQRLRDKIELAPDAIVVRGFGPATWAAGIDQFLFAARVHRDRHPDRSDQFFWLYPAHTELPRPVRHDVELMELTDTVHLIEVPQWWTQDDLLLDAHVALSVERRAEIRPRPRSESEMLEQTVFASTTVIAYPEGVWARPEVLADAIDAAFDVPVLEDVVFGRAFGLEPVSTTARLKDWGGSN